MPTTPPTSRPPGRRSRDRAGELSWSNYAMPGEGPGPDHIGETISHYEILGKIGEGGMGAVFKARDTRLERIVALKFLASKHGVDADHRARFLREAKSASA